MWSQDNSDKVSHRKEKIKEDCEEYNLLPMDRMTDISVCKILEKNPGNM